MTDIEQKCKVALQALSDWAVTYAPDMCCAKTVREARQRVLEHGTLAYIANATDQLHAVIQLLSEKWQPMNIAPLDGTKILIRTKDGCVSCAWDSTDQEWVAGWLGIALLKSDPLGWMPIHKHEMHGGGE
jgi:hypothetical protein